MMNEKLSRRGLLAGLGTASLLAPFSRASAFIESFETSSAKPFRVAFLTDMHIMDAPVRADEGIAFTLDHLSKQEVQPDLIIVGGDNLTGTMGRDLAGATSMRDRWTKVFRDKVKGPVLYCAGNHDHWGWNKTGSKSTGNEPLWGKNFARDMLQLDKLYYSVERGGWKFIVLDSVQPFESRYIGGLDAEQWEWLKGEIKSDLPTVITSHIPITGISPLVVDGTPGETSHAVPFGSTFKNMYDVVALIADHSNVKLALSGHIHFEESVTFSGTTYWNGGAVSGAWWLTSTADANRRTQRNPGPIPRLARANPGYSLLDLSPNGEFKIQQVASGWKGATSR
ncbi:MAG: metallophosphoesterase [Fimbriimonadaceae bacterium]|jgi:predicted MPP superfamily phosphohydrolase|nr:metallophosphoesterase [Fimbriimonadaceae bacterium]